MVVGLCENCRELDRVGTLLTGAHANYAIYGDDPHLAVSDSIGARCTDNRIDNSIHDIIVGENLDAHFRYEVNRVLSTSVHLNVSALATESTRLGDSETVDPNSSQGFLDLFELERLDDRSDELHQFSPSW